MKTVLTILAFALFFPLLLGMGQGPSSADKIPVPEQKFGGTFIDQMDVLTECTGISIEGGTFIEGKRGDGRMTIPFDRISAILFAMNAGTLTADVKLRDGSAVALVVKKDQHAYGYTKYGTFQIKLADLKKVSIAETLP